MTFCAITPTRGDRPEFLEHCRWMVARQTLPCDEHIVVDYPPEFNGKDLVPRLVDGITQARKNGHKYAFIIEDDDYYPPDYFKKMYRPEYKFVGDDYTLYYHIGNQGMDGQRHVGRSSLFCTGFCLDTIKDFPWSSLAVSDVFVDIALWKWVKQKNIRPLFYRSGAIGIKHGLGMTGGKGHRQRYYQFDQMWKELRHMVDIESFNFYTYLSCELL